MWLAPFVSKGYKVAVAARSEQSANIAQKYLFLQADLTDPSAVETTFATVIEKIVHPSVVVYNSQLNQPNILSKHMFIVV